MKNNYPVGKKSEMSSLPKMVLLSEIQNGHFELIHLCRMYFPILINWMSPFPILGLFGGIFSFFIQILKETYASIQWRI